MSLTIRKPPTPVKELPSLDPTIVYLDRETQKKFVENSLFANPEKQGGLAVIQKKITFKE